MQPVLIIQEVLSDLKLNFPVIPDLCNHARWREIICGRASQELRLGGETSPVSGRGSEMPPRNREEEGEDHQQILPTQNFDSS